jgi:hypothetical protein
MVGRAPTRSIWENSSPHLSESDERRYSTNNHSNLAMFHSLGRASKRQAVYSAANLLCPWRRDCGDLRSPISLQTPVVDHGKSTPSFDYEEK